MDYEEKEEVSDGVTLHRKWKNEIKAAKKELKSWHERGAKICDLYLDKRPEEERRDRKFNLFYSNTKILCDALFARIPKPEVTRRFKDAEDQVGRVASNILQRAITNELENDGYFTSTAKDIIKDYAVPGAGVAWVRYAPSLEKAEPVQLSEDTNTELAEMEGASPIITDELTPIDHVQWRDVLWSPARTWKEVRWIARQVHMDEDEIEERFGEEWAEKLCCESDDEAETALKTKDEDGPQNKVVDTVKVWEIWCKTSKRVYFYSDEADEILDTKEDPFGLPNFFPTARPLFAANSTDNLIPTPDYTFVQPQYEELNVLNSRISNLISACKVVGTYDKKSKELATVLSPSTPETLMVPVDSWDAFAQSGGIKGSTSFLPISEIAQVIQQLQSAAEIVKQQIYELTGISDIIRGQSSPYETAAAQGIKAQYASLRLQTRQTEVAEFFAELIRIKAFLMVKFYDPQRLVAKAGPMNQHDMQFVGPAIQLLKDELLANTSIEVSVDSLQLADWQQDKQEMNEAVSALANLLREAIPAAQQNPALGPMLLHIIKAQMSKYRGMREMESYIDEQLQAALAGSQQPQQDKVDPEEAKAQQAQMAQQAQQQAQLQQEQMKAQAEASQKAAELQLKERLAMAEIEFKERAKQADLQIEQQKLELEARKLRLEELKLTGTGIDTSELDFPVGDGTASTRMTKEDMVIAMTEMQQQTLAVIQQMQQMTLAAVENLINTPTPPASLVVMRDANGKMIGGTIQ